jgi:hypothetical protein
LSPNEEYQWNSLFFVQPERLLVGERPEQGTTKQHTSGSRKSTDFYSHRRNSPAADVRTIPPTRSALSYPIPPPSVRSDRRYPPPPILLSTNLAHSLKLFPRLCDDSDTTRPGTRKTATCLSWPETPHPPLSPHGDLELHGSLTMGLTGVWNCCRSAIHVPSRPIRHVSSCSGYLTHSHSHIASLLDRGSRSGTLGIAFFI